MARNTSQKLSPAASTARRTSRGSSARAGSGSMRTPSSTPARVRLQQPGPLLGMGQPVDGRRAHQARRLPASGAVGDVGLAIRVNQLLGEAGRGRPRLWVEIDHARLQLNRFAGDHLAETPQRGAGQFAGALLLQHLGAAGDEPHALGRREIGIGQPLHQSEGARRGALGVLRHLGGRRAHSVTVQRR